jgi:hypothetical protein
LHASSIPLRFLATQPFRVQRQNEQKKYRSEDSATYPKSPKSLVARTPFFKSFLATKLSITGTYRCCCPRASEPYFLNTIQSTTLFCESATLLCQSTTLFCESATLFLMNKIVSESLFLTRLSQTLPDSLADQRCIRVQLRRDMRTTARV